jgi:hypothetical protein
MMRAVRSRLKTFTSDRRFFDRKDGSKLLESGNRVTL